MAKSQRTKGAAGEREVCRIIRDTLGVDTHRNLRQYQAGGFDIQLGDYAIEVKRRRRIALYDWWHQAEQEAPEHLDPALVFRADGERWLAAIPLEKFLSLAREEIADAEDLAD